MKRYFKLSDTEKCEKKMKWKYLKSASAVLFHMEIDYFIKIHDPTVFYWAWSRHHPTANVNELDRDTILQQMYEKEFLKVYFIDIFEMGHTYKNFV